MSAMMEEEPPFEAPLELSPEMEERIRGHKVVALPTRRGRVRDMASGRPRTRSLSAGRSRIRPQDLVQDIYDRMGVGYKRGQETKLDGEVQPSSTYLEQRGRDPTPRDSDMRQPGFQDRYKAAARFSRGRSLEKEAEGEQRRARSLSRGRLAQRWPPNRSDTEPLSPNREQKQQLSPRSKSSPQQLSYGISPTRSFDMRPVYKPAAAAAGDTCTREFKDEKKETDENEVQDETNGEEKDEILRVTPPSVKDRIHVYGGGAKDRPKTPSRTIGRNVDPQYAAQFAVREKPPKIDIYAEGKKVEEMKEDSIPEAPQSPTPSDPMTDFVKQRPKTPTRTIRRSVDPQYAAQFAVREKPPKIDIYAEKKQVDEKKEESMPEAPLSPTPSDPMTDFVKQRKAIPNVETASKSSTNSRLTSKTSPIAHAFLSAISPTNKTARTSTSASAPVREISAPAEELAVNDCGSVAMSSVSGDEYGYRSAKETKKSSWQQDRNRVLAYANPNQSPARPTNPSKSTDDMERIIDERVQAQVNELGTRMEAQLKRHMQQIDERMTARLDIIERKMNSIVESIQRGMI